MKTFISVSFIMLWGSAAFGADSGEPPPANGPETYELRLWVDAWVLPNREPDIRAIIPVESHFFQRQILPSGELRILSGVLHTFKGDKYRLDFTLFLWSSPRDNIGDTSCPELEIDKPYGFITGSGVLTGHIMLITKSKKR